MTANKEKKSWYKINETQLALQLVCIRKHESKSYKFLSVGLHHLRWKWPFLLCSQSNATLLLRKKVKACGCWPRVKGFALPKIWSRKLRLTTQEMTRSGIQFGWGTVTKRFIKDFGCLLIQGRHGRKSLCRLISLSWLKRIPGLEGR